MDGATLRKLILEVIAERSKVNNQNAVATNDTLGEVRKRLYPGPARTTNLELEQAALTIWHDLLIGGYMAFGIDLNNCDPGWCHLTERGRQALKHLSRDPLNPDGYLEYLRQRAKLSPIALSYVEEALKTYAAGCWKATVVMIGAAAERLALDLREAILAKMHSLGKKPSAQLNDWKVKTFLAAIDKVLSPRRKDMPSKLAQRFEVNWLALASQIRIARNEAGHPTDTDPVSPESVQGAMLQFPELAATTTDLIEWVANSYT
jgi:hypothetical protein